MVAEEKMPLAVLLLERGFHADRVQQALETCNTVEEATKWLCAGVFEVCEDAEAIVCPARHHEQKLQPSSPALPAPAAPHAQEPPLSGSLQRPRQIVLQPLPPPQPQLRPPEVVVQIVPCNGSAFWVEAARRWPSVILAADARVFGRAAVVDAAGSTGDDRAVVQHVATPQRGEAVLAATVAPVPMSPPLRPRTSIAGVSSIMRRISTPNSPHQMRTNPVAAMCEICCNDSDPSTAVWLGCGHGWYCRKCMRKHAQMRLDNGFATVSCPVCETAIRELDLRKLLPAHTMERLLARSLDKAVSSVADLRVCPTPNCNMCVALEEGAEPRFECTVCQRESCLRCFAQPYHDNLTCEEYAAHAARKRPRRRNGQKEKGDMDTDDMLMRRWMDETGTKQCPTCGMGVTKQNLDRQGTQYAECHKMMCRSCSTKFCFKCLKVLTHEVSCGCTKELHGFCDPFTGERLNHLNPSEGSGRGRGGKRRKHATGGS